MPEIVWLSGQVDKSRPELTLHREPIEGRWGALRAALIHALSESGIAKRRIGMILRQRPTGELVEMRLLFFHDRNKRSYCELHSDG